MKKKILFINGHLDSGGCERSLIDVLKKLDYKKYEVDLLLLEHTGDYLEEVPEEVNIKVYSLDNAFGRLVPCLVRAIRKKDWFSFWFRVEYICGTKVSRHFMVCMRKLFKDLRKSYDIVIAYRPGICTELAAFTFQANKKISWWHHGEMNLSYHEIKSLDMAYKKMDSIVAVSNSSKKLLEVYRFGMWSLRKRGSLQKKKQRVLEFRPDVVVVSLERYVTLVWQRQLRRPERQTAYRNICADTQKQRSDI